MNFANKLDISNVATLNLKIDQDLDLALIAKQEELKRLEAAYINASNAISITQLLPRLTKFSQSCRIDALAAAIVTPDLEVDFTYCALIAEQMLAVLGPKHTKPYHVYPAHYVA